MSYRVTTKREYMSAMGIVGCLLLTAIVASWMFDGSFGVHLRGIGEWTLRKEEEPLGFWLSVGFLAAIGIVGTFISARAYSKARRAVKTPEEPNQ